MAHVSIAALRDVQRLIVRLNAGADLAATLRAVVDGVVEGLGFEVAVVSLVHDDKTVEAVAIAGPQDVSDTLLGRRTPLDKWERAFARSHPWGALRYEPHEMADLDDIPSWVPDIPVVDDPDAWHPLDALYAPLHSISGDLVGVLSVDLPRDGRRPGELQREMLEMYATQAGIAIDNARLAERLRESEEAFRLAFENAPFGMSIVDFSPATAGRFMRVNEAMCRMLGYSRRELQDRGIADITHPDDVPADERGHRRRGARRHRPLPAGEALPAGRRPAGLGVPADLGRPRQHGHAALRDLPVRGRQRPPRRAPGADPAGLRSTRSPGCSTGRPSATGSRPPSTRPAGPGGPAPCCSATSTRSSPSTTPTATRSATRSSRSSRSGSSRRCGPGTPRRASAVTSSSLVADDLGGAMLDELVARLREAVAAPIDVAGVTVELSVTVGTVAVTGAHGETADSLVAAADVDMYGRKPGAESTPDMAGPRSRGG